MTLPFLYPLLPVVITLIIVTVADAGLECDFEQPCAWTFEPPDAGFRVVSGKEKSGKSGHYAYYGTSKQEEVSVKIVSPYLQRTGPNCKLRFQYRLHGMPKTELLVVLEHLHDTAKPVTDSPMQMAMIPTRNSINSKWTEELVPIGAIRHPMRIRLEAWLNNQGRGTNPVNFSADSYIDQISLIDCQEELYHPDTCQRGRTNEKYRCELNKVCIEWDQLCDLKADCFDGEDEQKNCTQVPLGARCTFEDGMCGWVNSSEGDFRWVLANASYQQVVERELGHKDFTTDHTYGNASGHFMYAEHGQSDTIVRAYLTSPKFSRTSKAISDKSSPYYNQCRIRFFFRHIGRDWHSLHLHLLPADGTNQRRQLWEADPGVPAVPERLDSLRWTRVSVIIPHQDWEYQLQFTALRMALYRGHFGIDDVSMTPQCFIQDGITRDAPIAYPYNFTSCGSVGARGPNQTHCDVAYNNTAMEVKVVEASLAMRGYQPWPIMRGYQTWRVPMTGEYRIVAAGSAGGTLWGDEKRSGGFSLVHNYGTEIETVFNLTKDDQLLFLVGQRGESPCQRDPYRSLRFRSKAALLNEICSAKWTIPSKATDANVLAGVKMRRRKLRRRRRLNREATLISLFGKEYHSFLADLPGAGGGGATLVAKRNTAGTGSAAFDTLIVSAGGGGIFLGAYNVSMENQVGGNKLADDRRLQHASASAVWEDVLIAGGGGGFEQIEHGNQPVRIVPATGRPSPLGLAGGVCPRNGGNGGNGITMDHSVASWSFEGGFGGGGASCGPGGGGGGGFVGGAGGNFTHGSGGWSYTAHPNPIVRTSRNPGSGYIFIYPCLLPCPSGSMCQFVQSTPICRCRDGTIVEKQQSCPELPPEPHSPDDKTVTFHQPSFYSDHYLMFTVIIVALVSASVVAVVLYLIYRRRWRRKRKMDKYKRYNTGTAVGGGTMPMHQFPGGHNFHAEFNPNYEMFSSGALQELKEIPRQCVTLIRVLGQGAFGEVFEGEWSGETNNLPVAVKSLPEFATEQAQMDFHMEALIMSKFSHPNIVRFIGVCFEKMPRFIILELLAGGDLKTFLRENRPKCGVSTKLTMADLLHMALDVARGCQYLEDNHFIHRDIAARNCLLTTKSEDRVVKIADFGMARDIYRADYYRKGGKAMLPVKWMPPEAFLDGIFTTKTDVWSFGVLLWEIFSLGYMPYPGRGNQEVMQLVTAGGRLEAPTGCPAQVYQIMTQCWHTVADQRPRFSTIIERLGYCLQDPDVVNTALPILARNGAGSTNTVDLSAAMQASVHSNCFAAVTSPTTGVLQEIPEGSDGVDCAAATDPIKRAPYQSQTNGLSQPPEPMPTSGNGVSTGVCAPYQPSSPESFLPLHSSPKQSASSASECATDVLLVSSASSTRNTSNNESNQPSIIDQSCKSLSPTVLVQQPVASSPSSLFRPVAAAGISNGGNETHLDDDVFVAGVMNESSRFPPPSLHSTKPLGPI